MPQMMKAAIFVEPGRIEIADKPIPEVGPNDALVRITTTTICGTDVHILKGLTVGHEPVGVIEKLGSAVTGYREGQRVIAGAICPNFNSYAAQDGAPSQGAAAISSPTVNADTMATKPRPGGASAISSTVPGPNTCWCRMHRPIWLSSRTASPTNRC